MNLYTRIDQALKLTREPKQAGESDIAFIIRHEDYQKVAILNTIVNSTVTDTPAVIEAMLDDIIKKYTV
jgi:hypothetical protein